MKPLVCELCGSNDFVKKDGLFVCQHCGTKYTVEEAQRLMGTVKIDRSEEEEKYIEAGLTHSSNGDFETAYGYFTKALEINPNNEMTYLAQVNAKCEMLYRKEDWPDNTPDIVHMLATAFCVVIDIFDKKHPDAMSNARDQKGAAIIIGAFHSIGKNTAARIDRFVDLLSEEDGNKKKWYQTFSEFVESVNLFYKIMNKKLRTVYGDNAPCVKTCNEKWIEYLTKYSNYFTNLDGRYIIRSLNDQTGSDKSNSKKGFFSKLFS